MATPELRTSRLLLRGWRLEDRLPFAELNGDPRVTEFLGRIRDRAASDELLDLVEEHWDRHGFGLWAVERTADGAFLGFTGLSTPSFEAAFTPAVEVGWRFAHHAWGHGYATEAAMAALAFGFERLGLQEIVSFTTVANERSRRVMERLSTPTGGRALFTENVDELHTAFADLLDELSNQYLLGYQSTNSRRDDQWRRIKVEVDGHHDIRARQGYRASAGK